MHALAHSAVCVRVPASNDGLREQDCRFPYRSVRVFARSSVDVSMKHGSGSLLFDTEGRPELHADRLLRDLPIPCWRAGAAAGYSRQTEAWTQLTTLETAGREYYEFRAALMVRNNEGLTKTYNRFHDPHETSPDILKLRELHAAMDRAVLEAYGWHDLAETATCEFLLDYEDDEDEEDHSPQPRSQRAREEEALALPLARRVPRRSPRPPAGPEQGAGRTGTARGAVVS